MKVILTMLALTVSLNPVAHAGEAVIYKAIAKNMFRPTSADIAKDVAKTAVMNLEKDMNQATHFANAVVKNKSSFIPLYEVPVLEDLNSGLKVNVEARSVVTGYNVKGTSSYVSLDLNDVSLGNRLKIQDHINRNRTWLKQIVKVHSEDVGTAPYAIRIAQDTGDKEFMMKLSKLLLELKDLVSPNSSKIILSRRAVAVSASR